MNMKHGMSRTVVMLALVAGSSHSAEAAKKWDIDKDHTTVGFTVKHFFTPVAGVFNDLAGTIHFDPADLAGSVFDVTIPVAGIDTRNAKRDKHLQSPDFFNEKIGTTTVASLRIRHQLNRNDYGVGTGSWAATAVVGDEVNIEILMELHR